MTWKRTIILTSAWIGLGFGLARTTPDAYACSCLLTASWQLELESVDDNSGSGISGDLEGEQAYWTAEANLYERSLVLDNGVRFGLARVP